MLCSYIKNNEIPHLGFYFREKTERHFRFLSTPKYGLGDDVQLKIKRLLRTIYVIEQTDLCSENRFHDFRILFVFS